MEFFPLVYVLMLVSVIVLASGDHTRAINAEPVTTTRSVVTLENYLAYRTAVVSYAESNPAYSGSVALSNLTTWLPPNFVALGPWTNQITSSQIVVYASSNIGPVGSSTQAVSPYENTALNDAANYFIGYQVGGNWVTAWGGTISAAPGFVPSGALMSIVNRW